MADQPQVANRAVDQLLIEAGSRLSKTPWAARSVFGYDYAGGIADNQAYRATLYTQPGETYDQWVNRVDQELPGFAAMVGKDPQIGWFAGNQQGAARKTTWDMIQGGKFKGFSPDELAKLREQGKFADPNDLGATEAVPGQGNAGASSKDLLKEFAMHMVAPLDQNDPYVQQVVRSAGNTAQTDSRNRGVQGGYAVGNTEQRVAEAMTQTQMQRQQIGAAALGQTAQLDLGEQQLALQQYNQQYQAQMAQLQASYNNRLGGAQGVGGLIGGAIGGVAGAYFGGPAGAQAGIAAGSSLGAGVGGMVGGGSSPYLAYQPPAVGSSRRGGY